MAVPRRPHQPRAPRTTRASRISTHAATRAPQHTSPALPRLFAPCAGSAHCFWHLTRGCTRTRREYDADSAPRKARTHARTRARALIRSVFCTACQPACTHSIQHHQPACSALRPCHLASVCTARGARVARCARAPPSVQIAVQSACTQHRAHARNPRYMCTPRSLRTAMQPAPRDSRLPHVEPAPAARSTVRTVVSLSQKENKNHRHRGAPPKSEKDFKQNNSKKEGRAESAQKYSAEVLTTKYVLRKNTAGSQKNSRTL